MNSKSDSKKITFTTVEEYLAFYREPSKDEPSNNSEYYRVGEGVAKMACEKAIHNIED